MLLSEALSKFMFDRFTRGLSSKTMDAYEVFLKVFIRFVGDLDIEELTMDSIMLYIASLYNRQLSRATVYTYTRHLKVFLKWIGEDKIIRVHYDVQKIPFPKVNKKAVHLYNSEEIRMIFSLVVAESDWLIARNKACIALMLDSGLRQSEACGVKTAQYDRINHQLTICGKGEKWRIVPVGKLSTHYIEQYIQTCLFNIGEYLFLDRRGNPMSCNALKLLVHRIAVQLPFEFSCHKLRHNFATNYCIDMYEQKGHMDAYSLQILLGHSDMQTTMRYIHHAMSIVAAKAHVSHLDLLNSKNEFFKVKKKACDSFEPQAWYTFRGSNPGHPD